MFYSYVFGRFFGFLLRCLERVNETFCLAVTSWVIWSDRDMFDHKCPAKSLNYLDINCFTIGQNAVNKAEPRKQFM